MGEEVGTRRLGVQWDFTVRDGARVVGVWVEGEKFQHSLNTGGTEDSSL